MKADPPKLYRELASWWTLLSAPADYAEEAAFYQRTLLDACERSPRTLLELGSGGGNNASHLKARFEMVLREADGSIRVEHDRHVEGLFARPDWLRVIADAGFQPTVVPFEHSELEPGLAEVFVGRKSVHAFSQR